MSIIKLTKYKLQMSHIFIISFIVGIYWTFSNPAVINESWILLSLLLYLYSGWAWICICITLVFIESIIEFSKQIIRGY